MPLNSIITPKNPSKGFLYVGIVLSVLSVSASLLNLLYFLMQIQEITEGREKAQQRGEIYVDPIGNIAFVMIASFIYLFFSYVNYILCCVDKAYSGGNGFFIFIYIIVSIATILFITNGYLLLEWSLLIAVVFFTIAIIFIFCIYIIFVVQKEYQRIQQSALEVINIQHDANVPISDGMRPKFAVPIHTEQVPTSSSEMQNLKSNY